MDKLIEGRRGWIVALGAALCAAGCSFDPPAGIDALGLDQGGIHGANRAQNNRPPSEMGRLDMPPTPERDMERPPGPEDMPTPDAGPGARDMPVAGEDMPVAGEDMPGAADMGGGDQGPAAEMGPPRDMRPPSQGRLGDRCQDSDDCIQGRCEVFDGQGVCTIDCVSSCPDEDLACVQGLCTPSDLCDGAGQGPGCPGCNSCADQAECVELIGPGGQITYSCECPQGYQGDGYTCLNLDECDAGTDACVQNATCYDTLGDYECRCDEGFVGDGRVACDPAPDVCAMCDVRASCVGGPGMEDCECNPGWVGDGFACDDLDECGSGLDDCHPTRAECLNIDGGYNCRCLEGYSGDGVTCMDVDECDDGIDMCDPLAECLNTTGGYDCTCPEGVAGDGFTCTPYASCSALKQAEPSTPTGEYVISAPQGPLTVWCDMDSDGGVGYTMVRIDDPALKGSQAAYEAACSSLGMDIITPRSREHMDAIVAWNGAPPNLVDVVPRPGGGRGLGGWQGRCAGQSCDFFLTGRDNSRCRTLVGQGTDADPYQWSSGAAARSCRDYLETAATTSSSGLYRVDLDGAGPRQSFVTRCQMDRDGGGWTLAVVSSDDGQDTWTWARRDRWTTDTTPVGSAGMLREDYKNEALHELVYRDVMFIHVPSTIWAVYGGVGDGSGSFSDTLASAPVPNCEPTSGFAKTAGPLLAAGSLCNTDLYLHPGDYDGNQIRCSTLFSTGLSDDSTFGPAWSASNNQSCPFDDPANTSLGPDFHDDSQENPGNGFADALGINVSSGGSGAGINSMRMYLRDGTRIAPEGGNANDERLVRTATQAGDAGPACTYGSWDARGDTVLEQGWVICGLY